MKDHSSDQEDLDGPDELYSEAALAENAEHMERHLDLEHHLEMCSEPGIHPIPALFSFMGIDVTKDDEFDFKFKGGFAHAQVKHSSGKVESVTLSSQKGFKEMRVFNSSEMGKRPRNELIIQLYRKGRGESQSSLAKTFGLTQPHISRIVSGEDG